MAITSLLFQGGQTKLLEEQISEVWRVATVFVVSGGDNDRFSLLLRRQNELPEGNSLISTLCSVSSLIIFYFQEIMKQRSARTRMKWKTYYLDSRWKYYFHYFEGQCGMLSSVFTSDVCFEKMSKRNIFPRMKVSSIIVEHERRNCVFGTR